ncbi:MAG: diadenosine tetraphosphatase [Gammaproteobacteria bacterium SG8_47]|nr:MAG: diadenosine tetraphosphatase [Gammaproteobacteria bacterium SG8_47]
MAVYAIGDLQGCFDALQRLFEKLRFDPAADQVWFTGDLVNRGPLSLESLRFVKSLGDSAVTVLGNHDLHLLAVAEHTEKKKRQDTLDPILNAADRDELLDWLRSRPLLHHDETLSFTMVHAGLPPQWDLAQARACAAELESVLRGPDYAVFFQHMYGNEPSRWSEELNSWERLRFIVNSLTRMRFCDAKGRMDLRAKGAPGSQSKKLMPWFQVPGRRNAELRIVFGHWSTLGRVNAPGIYSLDSGCVWGGTLTALRLDADELPYTSIECEAACRPH